MQTIHDQQSYKEFIELYQTAPDKFWQQLVKNHQWSKLPSQNFVGNLAEGKISWFGDAKLNITENCLDRHAATTPHKKAILFEPNQLDGNSYQLTYKELLEYVEQYALALDSLGIKPGDVVCLYMSMVPQLLIATLACARIGAVHSIVFGGFSAKALQERLQDCEAKLLMTNTLSHRGDKTIDLLKTAREASQNCPHLKNTIVYQGDDPSQSKELLENEIDLDSIIHDFQGKARPATQVSGDHPLFILYTSGSTGKPKGLVHAAAGYMVWAQYSFQTVFQAKQPEDIFWCTADMGWITGHSYFAYGPLLSGVTQVMFEGIPTYPAADRFWKIIDKYQVTHFYTAPTAIRSLQSFGDAYLKGSSRQSLKVLGTVGEPIGIEAWQWFMEKVGHQRCPIVDTWWQTETGGIMISTIANITESVATYATFPIPGVSPQLLPLSDSGQSSSTVTEGILCISQPWPGMAQTIWGNHQRYIETYFSPYPGYYFTGDGARVNEKGHIQITGRVDDVINISGHRIGTAEVENAINLHPLVQENAVIAVSHDIKGQAIWPFIVMDTAATDQLSLVTINEIISKEIGPIAKAEKVFIVPGLPKTRSGKIMRRILRKIAENQPEQIGDTSTLLNPECIDHIIQIMRSPKEE